MRLPQRGQARAAWGLNCNPKIRLTRAASAAAIQDTAGTQSRAHTPRQSETPNPAQICRANRAKTAARTGRNELLRVSAILSPNKRASAAICLKRGSLALARSPNNPAAAARWPKLECLQAKPPGALADFEPAACLRAPHRSPARAPHPGPALLPWFGNLQSKGRGERARPLRPGWYPGCSKA